MVTLLLLLRGAQYSRKALPLHAARATATKRTGERKVDVLLAVDANHEARDIDDLLADTVCDSARGGDEGSWFRFALLKRHY